MKRAGYEVRPLLTPLDDEVNATVYRYMSRVVTNLSREADIRSKFGPLTDHTGHIPCSGDRVCELRGCYDSEDDDVLLSLRVRAEHLIGAEGGRARCPMLGLSLIHI